MMDINTFKNIIFSIKHYWKPHVLSTWVNISKDLEKFTKSPRLGPFHNFLETLWFGFWCFQGKSEFVSEESCYRFHNKIEFKRKKRIRENAAGGLGNAISVYAISLSSNKIKFSTITNFKYNKHYQSRSGRCARNMKNSMLY